jgi:hypothetical protein
VNKYVRPAHTRPPTKPPPFAEDGTVEEMELVVAGLTAHDLKILGRMVARISQIARDEGEQAALASIAKIEALFRVSPQI